MTTEDNLANLANLPTETRNPRSEAIDTLSTGDMLRVINEEDATVAARVAEQIPLIAKAVDAITARVTQGGRLFYIGAGTSGRLGVLDASECPPTYGVSRDLVQGIIAGGDSALRVSAEGAEDSHAQGAADLMAHGFCSPQSHGLPNRPDTLVGIAASGRTPYVLGAIEHARALGCLTVGLSCVPDSLLAIASEIAITPATGPEVITGSTRMKAGTATKLVLNMLSTGLMVRLGHVYGNLMIHVAPTNGKLVDRAERIVAAAAGLTAAEAAGFLQGAGDVKTAIVMARLRLDRGSAEAALTSAGGNLRGVLDGLPVDAGRGAPGRNVS